ncbi:MAG: glycosyltransferase [Anaerolineae bacterium]|nr:glycosyltransferase [Anaerolineae bacterium]
MMTDFPRLLIISEVTLSQQGLGAGRTLFNLFENYPAEQVMLLSPQNYLKTYPTDPPFDQQVLSFPGGFLPASNTRFGKYINPLVKTVNLQILDWLPIFEFRRIKAFSPEVILVCPLTSWCLLMGAKVSQAMECPSLIYLMDDWLANDNARWLSGSLQQLAYRLLTDTAGWLMISPQLERELAQRYDVTPNESLVVHNPVDLTGKQPPPDNCKSEGPFKVVYAGSIWPMHYDALAAVAEAIYQLKSEGVDIELILYTPASFWEAYQVHWDHWHVTYGGLIAYQEMDSYLRQADLLLVTASFLPEHISFTRSSVQTKLTDYMLAGRPILACGPSYSACNAFVKKWECGLVCETNQIEKIKELLLDVMNNPMTGSMGVRAFEAVKNNFEKELVSRKLTEFIKETSPNYQKLIVQSQTDLNHKAK